MKTLKLTDEQYETIKKITELRKTMDRRCTHLPFYSVQTRVEEFRGVESGYSDHCGIHDDEGKCLIENREDFLNTIGYGEEDLKDCDKDYLDNLEILDFNSLDSIVELLNKDPETNEDRESMIYDVYYFDYRYEDRSYFLTEQEALEYCKYQKHNLCHPRTYAYHAGYANQGFFPKLLKIFDELKLEDESNED